MEKDISTSPSIKIFYRPIEIAIRWCDLVHRESEIIKKNNQSTATSKICCFPCIQQKLGILWDAIRHQELPYGCLGITLEKGKHVETPLLTIRHTDLKTWFSQFHPTEKPNFLFDELERRITTPYLVETYNTLLVQADIYKSQREQDQLAT